jgi:hypothetical protein
MLQIVEEVEAVITYVADRKTVNHGGEHQADCEVQIEELKSPLAGELKKARPGSQA